MSTIPHTRYERNAFKLGFHYCIGVDEVGVGALAGPVVVCAVSWHPRATGKLKMKYSEVRDSKIMTARQRERIARELTSDPLLFLQVVSIDATMIDTLSIHRATHRGMRQAVANVVRTHSLTRPFVLVDGNRQIPECQYPQRTLIGGDGRAFSIACASIVAKVHRDALMTAVATQYPDYGFQQHKGYGTEFHYEQLARFGPTPLHRKTFRLTAAPKKHTLVRNDL